MADGSLSQFKATLARKKAREEKRRGKIDNGTQNYKSLDNKSEYDFPKLSDSELDEVKNDIRKKLKSGRRKEIFLIVITIIIMSLLVYYLI